MSTKAEKFDYNCNRIDAEMPDDFKHMLIDYLNKNPNVELKLIFGFVDGSEVNIYITQHYKDSIGIGKTKEVLYIL